MAAYFVVGNKKFEWHLGEKMPSEMRYARTFTIHAYGDEAQAISDAFDCSIWFGNPAITKENQIPKEKP